MAKFKKLLAVLLAMMLIVSMTACSKDDDKKTNGKSEEKKDLTLSEAIAEAEYTKGSYKMDMSIDMDIDGEESSMAIKANGDVDGENQKAGMSFELKDSENDMSFDFGQFMVVADGKMYLDIDTLISNLWDVDTEFGAYGIPMPEAEVSKDLQKKATELLTGLIDAATKDLEVKAEDGVYTIEITDPETLIKVAQNVVTYIDENKDDIESLVEESTKSVDVKEYMNTLFDYISEDLIDAAELLGFELSEDDLEEVKDAIDEMEISETEINLFEGWDEVVESINDASAEDFDGDELKLTMVFTVTDEKFGYDIDFTMTKGEESMEMAMNYEFTVDEDMSIKAPENATTLTGMVEYIMDNQDVLMDLADAVNAWAEDLGVSSDVEDNWADDDWSDDEDYDDEYDEDWSDDDWSDDEEVEVSYDGTIGSFAFKDYTVSFDSEVLEVFYVEDYVDFDTVDGAGYVDIYVWEDETLDYNVDHYTSFDWYTNCREVTINGEEAYIIDEMSSSGDEIWGYICIYAVGNDVVEVDVVAYEDDVTFTDDEIIAYVEAITIE